MDVSGCHTEAKEAFNACNLLPGRPRQGPLLKKKRKEKKTNAGYKYVVGHVCKH